MGLAWHARESVQSAASRVQIRAKLLGAALIAELCPPTRRADVTRWIYNRADEYRKGGAFFDRGLFPWEEDLVVARGFPVRGTVLVGGVGGGRWLRPLSTRGYRVLGFDPSNLIEHAREVARTLPHVKVARGRYQDLGPAVRGAGPLAGLFDGETIDAVVLAFGSITHISPTERRAMMRDLKALAPGATVFLTFPSQRKSEWMSWYRNARSWIRVLRRPRSDDGADFILGAGFVYLTTRSEIEAMCQEAGYSLEDYVEQEYGTALARPSRRDRRGDLHRIRPSARTSSSAGPDGSR